jgi:hypothetical protein
LRQTLVRPPINCVAIACESGSFEISILLLKSNG